MKTSDGYVIKTSDGYPVVCKDPDDYNYPLTAHVSPKKSFHAAHDKKNYTVVIDQ